MCGCGSVYIIDRRSLLESALSTERPTGAQPNSLVCSGKKTYRYGAFPVAILCIHNSAAQVKQ